MSVVELDNTFGALLLGVLCAAVFYGVTCVQTIYYYTHHLDRWPLKLLVGAVVLADTANQILSTHAVYTYCIVWWGDFERLASAEAPWSSLVCVALAGLSGLLVQSFMMMRVWRFSDRNIVLTGIIGFLVCGGFGAVLAYVYLAFRDPSFASLVKLWALTVTVNIMAVASDMLIAAALCILLHRSRTGYRRSDSMINRLILFSVNTGIATSICAVACLISLLAAKNSFLYMAFYNSIPRFYTNTLLASLNSRRLIRASGEPATVSALQGLSFTRRTTVTVTSSSRTDKMEPSSLFHLDTPPHAFLTPSVEGAKDRMLTRDNA